MDITLLSINFIMVILITASALWIGTEVVKIDKATLSKVIFAALSLSIISLIGGEVGEFMKFKIRHATSFSDLLLKTLPALMFLIAQIVALKVIFKSSYPKTLLLFAFCIGGSLISGVIWIVVSRVIS